MSKSTRTRPAPWIFWLRRGLALLLAVFLVLMIVEAGKSAFSWLTESSGKSEIERTKNCSQEQLAVMLQSTNSEYRSGGIAIFTASIENDSKNSCTVRVTNSTVKLQIVSGSDRIWDSTDCPLKQSDELLLLRPGAKQAIPFNWKVERSTPACPDGLPSPRPGTYKAKLTVKEQEIEPLVF